MNGDNIVTLPLRQARELTQLEAITMAMDSAADRGRAGDPQAFLDGLPWGWSVVNTNAVGQLAGELVDALAGGLDGDDDDQDGDDAPVGRLLLVPAGDPWAELPASAMVPDQRP